MSEDDARIARMADLAGIEPHYRDVFGRDVPTSPAARRAVLQALGFPAESEAGIREGLERLDTRAHALAPRLIVAEADRPFEVPLTGPHGEAVDWRLTNEAVSVTEGRGRVVAMAGRAGLAMSALASGYYRLALRSGDRAAEATVISAPARCWRPEGRGFWGVSGAIYGLASARDLGIGDLTDVGAVAAAAGRRGADFLGLSPLHALFPADRTRISPYSPSSRLFVDPIFIDPTKAPGFGEDARRMLDGAGAALAALRSGALIDHAAVWAIKRPILEAAWRAFRERGRSREFERFRIAGGAALEGHATFDALHEHFAGQGVARHQWPAACRDRRSAEIGAFRAAAAERVDFHRWLQWLADGQLGAAARSAKASSMAIGLYCDLAVGADRDGSDVWSAPEHFAGGLSIGAPPDPLAPQGQDWGLPPVHPFALADSGLAPLRGPIAAAMRHAGAIRVDHAFQLRRLFLIPTGEPASLGAYVAYPAEAMLAALRLESHRARCLVIGEDLGTAPPGFAQTLETSGILSYRVLYFERGHDGAFLPPAAYPEHALAVVNTHDLATFAGWWRGQDIADRIEHGITPAANKAASRAERALDRERLWRLLRREGLAADEHPGEAPPFTAVARLMARCRSDLVGLSLDDIGGAVEAANIPGVVAGAPNWRRRIPLTVEQLEKAGGPLDLLARAMAGEGRGHPPKTPPEQQQQ